jgi:catechol 2,3-dioxygenase-like lactoylglutathione lyase family enzyme
MKRMHMHVGVSDLAHSIRFYSALFGMPPTVEKHDYAKWMVEDPRLNFAISTGSGHSPGLNHVGIQAETADELHGLYQNLRDASIATREETGAQCCYAVSDKHWAIDPTGLVWEMYHTMDAIEVYGEDRVDLSRRAAMPPASACGAGCAPSGETKDAVCCG